MSEKEISTQFHLPIILAAKKLGVCVTALKSRCRQLGISRWPFRKVRKVDNVIKALVDQKAVLKPQEAVQKCYLKNALDIRKHILSNPNSTAHLQIKKRKNSTSLSEDSASDTTSEQILQDTCSDTMKAANVNNEIVKEDMCRAEIISASLPRDQNVRETRVAISQPQPWVNKNLVSNLNLPIQLAAVQTQMFPQAQVMWQPQLPVSNGLQLQQALKEKQTEIYKEQFVKAFQSLLAYNNLNNQLSFNNNVNTQKAMLQMASLSGMNMSPAMQNNLANNCVLLNK